MPDPQDYRELVKLVAAVQAKASTSSLFFDGADRLRLRTFGSVGSVAIAVEGRLLGADGCLAPFAFPVHTPNSDRTVATTTFDLGEGFLLNVALRASSGSPRIGQVYGILDVVRGLGAVQTPVGVLWQGYLTDTTPAGWPGVALRASVDGPGVLRSITGTDPAANVEISEAVPTNARWRPLSIRFSLVTDANAANREVALTFDDGANVYARIPSRFTHVASLTFGYTAALNAALETVAQDTEKLIRLPPIVMQGGHRFNTVTTGRQVTDNYGAPQYLVEEWIED